MSRPMRQPLRPPLRHVRILVAALLGAATMLSTAASAAPGYAPIPVPGLGGPFTIKPPEMLIPAGTKPGSLRRIVQPFGPWTLICDENLKARKRVCNVSQTIVDPAGKTVFSWSLAAREGGAPLFIIRLPAGLARDHFAQVVFGRKDPLEAGVILSTCDAATCLGYLTVDARIQRQIAAHAEVAIKVLIGPSVETFGATLEGLGQAVASLK